MSNDWQKQTEQLIEQGRQSTAGVVSGGEMLIDADPESGFFRAKLRNIQPADRIPQLVRGFCYILSTSGAMFNLTVKQHIKGAEEKKDE
ncbi:MAG: hypothetical protein JRF50_18925 [Deltaproteobacteria bacterium]|nr:hypothetical protein [Deltaproteobacteria bacterium]